MTLLALILLSALPLGSAVRIEGIYADGFGYCKSAEDYDWDKADDYRLFAYLDQWPVGHSFLQEGAEEYLIYYALAMPPYDNEEMDPTIMMAAFWGYGFRPFANFWEWDEVPGKQERGEPTDFVMFPVEKIQSVRGDVITTLFQAKSADEMICLRIRGDHNGRVYQWTKHRPDRDRQYKITGWANVTALEIALPVLENDPRTMQVSRNGEIVWEPPVKEGDVVAYDPTYLMDYLDPKYAGLYRDPATFRRFVGRDADTFWFNTVRTVTVKVIGRREYVAATNPPEAFDRFKGGFIRGPEYRTTPYKFSIA
jgi:hypothetical protein